jgi:hypothetical protein
VTKEFASALAAIDDRMVGDPTDWSARYAELSPLEQTLYVVNCLNFECVSGGLGAYFSSSAGARWREALEALERTGARQALDIFKRALALFPTGGPSEDPPGIEREALDPSLQKELSRLDGEYEDLAVMEALERYWRSGSSDGPSA